MPLGPPRPYPTVRYYPSTLLLTVGQNIRREVEGGDFVGDPYLLTTNLQNATGVVGTRPLCPESTEKSQERQGTNETVGK